MPVVTLFHGTGRRFDAFGEDSIGRGGDANSALGVFLSEAPTQAASYACDIRERPLPDGRVLVVEADVDAALVCSSPDEFLRGIPAGREGEPDAVPDHEDAAAAFAAARQRLLREGVQAVCTDGIYADDEGTWVVLDPARLRVVGEMSVEEAWHADAPRDWQGLEMRAGDLFPETNAPAPR